VDGMKSPSGFVGRYVFMDGELVAPVLARVIQIDRGNSCCVLVLNNHHLKPS
jgi:hypothetical protein